MVRSMTLTSLLALISPFSTVVISQEIVVSTTPTTTTTTSTTVSSSQYWHEMYHGDLSMAAYGDYNTLCPKQRFTEATLRQSFPDSTEDPWTLLEEFGPTDKGTKGFSVIIPEMDKVVIVIRGAYGWQAWNDTPAALNNAINIGSGCPNVTCTAHAGALEEYLEIKRLMYDFATAQEAVERTGHQFSVTGHGSGGMIAQILALDLGFRGKLHWSHSHGAPRVFNPAAANLYNKLFAGEAGQRTVANNDSIVTFIPESDNYTFTLQGFHIFGENSTYGMSYAVCNSPEDTECTGGAVFEDHLFYYAPVSRRPSGTVGNHCVPDLPGVSTSSQLGQCGTPNKYNATLQDAAWAALVQEYAKSGRHLSDVPTAPRFQGTHSNTSAATPNTTMTNTTTTNTTMTNTTTPNNMPPAANSSTSSNRSPVQQPSTPSSAATNTAVQTGLFGLVVIGIALLTSEMLSSLVES